MLLKVTVCLSPVVQKWIISVNPGLNVELMVLFAALYNYRAGFEL